MRVRGVMVSIASIVLVVGLLHVTVLLLARNGLVTAEALREKRRWAVVTISAVAAVLTPPDPFSMIAMAMSMVMLYELVNPCAWLVHL